MGATDKLEQNLLEFPLGFLEKNPATVPGPIVVQDRIKDSSSGEWVTREVTIRGGDGLGPLTATDILVLRALMVLTWRKTRFASRIVSFSLYELRQLLRWANDGREKRRLILSLERIKAVTVKFENAWRRNSQWVSTEWFGLVDNVALTNTRRHRDDQIDQHLKWNDVIVQSVQAGNVKPFDWDFYVSLKSPVARRLYELLEKRFRQGITELSPELKHFCPNKLGMKQGQSDASYRKGLKRGLDELVRRGYLVEPVERFRQGKVVFVAASRSEGKRNKKTVADAPVSPLEQTLITCGVEPGHRTATCAGSLVAKYNEQKILRCLAYWKTRNKGVGDLIASITHPSDRGFVPQEFRTPNEVRAAATRRYMRERAARGAAGRKFPNDADAARKSVAALTRARERFPVNIQRELEQAALARLGNVLISDGIKRERSQGEVGVYHQLLWTKHILPMQEVA